MKSIRKLFSTILILSCFFLIGLGLQEVVLAGTVQLPKTGQTTCYDTNGNVIPCVGTGQDGDIQAGVGWPNPRFAVSGDCVTDNLTGLMWAKNANLPNGTLNWQGALDYVASLNSGSGICGYHDWRLPNVNELESLVHADQSNSATWLNTQGLPMCRSKRSTGRRHPVSATPTMPGSSKCCMAACTTAALRAIATTFGQCVADRLAPSNYPKPGRLPANNSSGTVISCAGTGQDGDNRAGWPAPNPRFTVSGDCVGDNLTGLMSSQTPIYPGPDVADCPGLCGLSQ